MLDRTEIKNEFNDFFPTTAELSICAADLMAKARAREADALRKRRIDEIKSFLPEAYMKKHDLL